MKTELKIASKSKYIQVILAFCCIVFGALCGILGEIAFPLPIAFLATLFLFDSTKQRRLSVVISLVLVAMNIATITFRLSSSLFGVASVILAYLIYQAFSKKQSKSDYAFIMTLIGGFIILGGYILLPMNLKGEYTREVVTEFYGSVVSTLRDAFVDLFYEAYTTAGLEITKDMITEIFNAQVNMVISYLLIAAFFVVGVSFKLFGLLVRKLASDDSEIASFRFFTSSLFAYFYVILTLVSMFASALTGIFGIVILNLYNFFLFVYSYVGFNLVFTSLVKKFKPFISFIILIFALALMSTLAVQILAVLGVLFTIRKNAEIGLSTK